MKIQWASSWLATGSDKCYKAMLYLSDQSFQIKIGKFIGVSITKVKTHTQHNPHQNNFFVLRGLLILNLQTRCIEILLF